ncbi:hypothetical protein GCM10017744_011830 [Streptomyces antimycoticus]
MSGAGRRRRGRRGLRVMVGDSVPWRRAEGVDALTVSTAHPKVAAPPPSVRLDLPPVPSALTGHGTTDWKG